MGVLVWKGTNTNVEVNNGRIEVNSVSVNATAPEEVLQIQGTNTNVIVKGGALLIRSS